MGIQDEHYWQWLAQDNQDSVRPWVHSKVYGLGRSPKEYYNGLGRSPKDYYNGLGRSPRSIIGLGRSPKEFQRSLRRNIVGQRVTVALGAFKDALGGDCPAVKLGSVLVWVAFSTVTSTIIFKNIVCDVTLDNLETCC